MKPYGIVFVALIALILIAGCASTPRVESTSLSHSVQITTRPTQAQLVTPVTPRERVTVIVTTRPTAVATTRPTATVTKTSATPAPTPTPTPTPVRVVARAISPPQSVVITHALIGNHDVTTQMVTDLQPLRLNGTVIYNPCGVSIYWDNTTQQRGSGVATYVYTNSSEVQECFSIIDYARGRQLREDLSSLMAIEYTVSGVRMSISAPAMTEVTL